MLGNVEDDPDRLTIYPPGMFNPHTLLEDSRLEDLQNIVERKVGVVHVEAIERLPDIRCRRALSQRMKIGQGGIASEAVERLFGLPFNEKQNLPRRGLGAF
ncbi:hypothetical protein R4282_02060 [Rhodococcus oxybenzonivorans]|uniref:hypothetical protein n=1 Tax=Rhodococcus oxybenzonivorans TaxID=1990687 RepID=UPI002954EEE4|nr:hypothetical protein [Rhodococcus oxybenzonivorans]MDV7351799.1 hypothetical protein [Rhodococcus oxybenzonivorans]